MGLECISAYVDFNHPLPLDGLAQLLSERIFAGIPFTGENTGIWDEVPALRLARDFLGLRVELGGSPDPASGYTLQIEPFDFPWDQISADLEKECSVDLSDYVRFLLSRVNDVVLR